MLGRNRSPIVRADPDQDVSVAVDERLLVHHLGARVQVVTLPDLPGSLVARSLHHTLSGLHILGRNAEALYVQSLLNGVNNNAAPVIAQVLENMFEGSPEAL